MKNRVASLAARVDGHFARCAALAAAGVGGAMVVAPQAAEAAVISSGAININVPSTTAGVYINVVTGVNNISPGLAPGWDINPWSGTNLNFFNPTAPAGGVYSRGGATAGVANLPVGYTIDATNIWTSGSASTNAGWTPNLNSSNNCFGFRFQDETDQNRTKYGWMRIALSTSLFAQPRAVVEYAYESTGGGIGACVPEPSSLALIALGALGLIRRR